MKRAQTTVLAALAAAALLAPATALAQQEINDTRTVSPTVRVEIEDIIVGHIRVIGGSGDQLVVTGTIGADVDEFVIEGGPDMVEIYADLDDWDHDDHDEGRRRWRGRDHHDVDVELVIRVPSGASLEMEGVTATFEVEGVDGDIDIETVTGEIHYSGNAATLDLSNVTGSITAAAPALRRGDFECVNGAIRFTGSLADNGELSLENVNGNIEIVVPADISASFYVETMMGNIENAFGQEPVRASRWVPSKELHFTNGSGRAEIHAETLQGSVRIRHQ